MAFHINASLGRKFRRNCSCSGTWHLAPVCIALPNQSHLQPSHSSHLDMDKPSAFSHHIPNCFKKLEGHIDDLVQYCSISSDLAKEIMQSCTKPSIQWKLLLRICDSGRWMKTNRLPEQICKLITTRDPKIWPGEHFPLAWQMPGTAGRAMCFVQNHFKWIRYSLID